MIIFVTVVDVHDASMALIVPTNVLMGLWVHSGYEFLPKWWNRTWLTKWFISATFHDHHHKYFTANFGGYTTVWDRLCGTVHKRFESDFVKIKERPLREPAPEAVAAE
jgi:sterol desaturase/sphingolipid hydroxylase (fatty acid hydroxylase superfamily)